MAVSQVDRLKNPCRVTTWNNFVASQPPSSAPPMPITQVIRRPCDLLPGISILASRPAPSPRTIHAMIPITRLLYCDEADGRSGAGSRPGGLAPPWLRDTSPSDLTPSSQARNPGGGKNGKPRTSSPRPITRQLSRYYLTVPGTRRQRNRRSREQNGTTRQNPAAAGRRSADS